MKNEQLLKDILESKKVKSANRKPRYATRKLSIGLVSCLLGFITFVGVPHGQIAYAEENVATTTTIEEKVKKKEVVETTENLMRVKETEEEEIEDNSLMVEAEKDIDKEKQIKKRIDTAGLQNLETEPKEEEQIAEAKNEDPATETKEETQAPAPTEENKEEKPVSEEEKKDEKDSEETEKKETKSEEKPEISDPIPVGQLREAPEEAGNDISSQLEELKVNLYANNESKDGTKVTPLRGPIEANEGQDIGMDISF